MSSSSNSRSGAYLRSAAVAVALAVLTVIEYFAAISFPTGVVMLMLLASLKAVLVLYFFMHVSRLWSKGEEH